MLKIFITVTNIITLFASLITIGFYSKKCYNLYHDILYEKTVDFGLMLSGDILLILFVVMGILNTIHKRQKQKRYLSLS